MALYVTHGALSTDKRYGCSSVEKNSIHWTVGLMFEYFGCSWMFVESNRRVLSVGDIDSEWGGGGGGGGGGVRGCSRILQIPQFYLYPREQLCGTAW